MFFNKAELTFCVVLRTSFLLKGMANSKISLPIYSFNIKNKLKKSKNPRIKILIKYVKFYNNLYL